MMAERKPFVVVCVPAFNEEDRIASVIFIAGMTVEGDLPQHEHGAAGARALRYVDGVIGCGDGSEDLMVESLYIGDLV
jgi:hypothetical protein